MMSANASYKSTALIFIFAAYTMVCIGLVGYLTTHPLPAPNSISETISLNKEIAFKDNREKPDFKNIKTSQEKKLAFFNYLIPMINHLNNNISIRRSNLLAIQNELQNHRENEQKSGAKNNEELNRDAEQETREENNSTEFSRTSIKYLHTLSKQYGINTEKNSPEQQLNKLLLRVDQIPASMVLAQAANESGWGTSRFALKANNFFGQWCFKKGCGIIPEKRTEGDYHEVAKFNSVYGSVRSYFKNINTHRAYKELRNHRATLRIENKPVTGHEMITHLLSYSERGEDYVKGLRRMIRRNKLSQHDHVTATTATTSSQLETEILDAEVGTNPSKTAVQNKQPN